MRKLKFYLVFTLSALFLVSGCARGAKVTKFTPLSGPIPKDGVMEMVAAAQAKPDYEERFVRKRYVYIMAWNGINVGRIIAEFGDIIEYRGRQVFTVKLVTESNKFLSKIFRVEDTFISYVDTETLTSRYFEADRKEGNYRKHLVVEYDFDSLQAIYSNLKDGSVKRCKIYKDVHDPLSAVCRFMTMPVKLNEKAVLIVNLNEKNFEVSGRVDDLEVIKLPGLGSFPAFKIRPEAMAEGQTYDKGKGYLYFSADKDRYPLYGVVQIPFGKVTATLHSIDYVR
ncbi:MAG: DUF3108 domain-containing protein [Candidatus Omnitrophica bacterium]|nr:DUF3108 domain-containing protein [Candidatus Omnitrophota bacterium]